MSNVVYIYPLKTLISVQFLLNFLSPFSGLNTPSISVLNTFIYAKIGNYNITKELINYLFDISFSDEVDFFFFTFKKRPTSFF